MSSNKATMVNLHSGPTPRGREGSEAADAIDAAAMIQAAAVFMLTVLPQKIKHKVWFLWHKTQFLSSFTCSPSPRAKFDTFTIRSVRALIATSYRSHALGKHHHLHTFCVSCSSCHKDIKHQNIQIDS
jgi:hypothetical protein